MTIGCADELAEYRRRLDDMRAERREENRLAGEHQERRRELEVRDLIESPEGEAARWDGIFRASPPWSRQVIYSQDRG